MSELNAPLIVTLKLDEASFTQLNTLRQAHFPPERNYLPAHITLFHALPGAEKIAIRELLTAASASNVPFQLEMPGLRFLGRGVAIEVRSEILLSLRARLAEQFRNWLTRQDSQGYRPHVTIQNKVLPDVARSLLHSMMPNWRPCQATAEGLLLWEYLGGPWRQVADFSFFKSTDTTDVSSDDSTPQR